MEVWDEGMFIFRNFCSLSEWNAKGWVKAYRSLRLRDPLYPFLFAIFFIGNNNELY